MEFILHQRMYNVGLKVMRITSFTTYGEMKHVCMEQAISFIKVNKLLSVFALLNH